MESTHCTNCKSVLYGKFCSHCGQKVYTDRDKSWRHLWHEAIHFITHFEGKIGKTITTIYRKPGQLTLDYTNGIRQPYYKPVSLYLFIVVLYLLFPMASGMNMEMKYYKGIPFFGNYVAQQIEHYMWIKGVTEDQLTSTFAVASKNTSKFLLLLLIPLSVPLLRILYFKRKPYLFDVFILATEINIFFLLTFFLLLPLLLLPVTYFWEVVTNDQFFAPFTLALFILYCSILFRKMFLESWWLALIKGIIFSLLFVFLIVSVYRIIVFEVTFAWI